MQMREKIFLNKSFVIFLIIGVINTFNGSVLAFFFSLFISNANKSFILGYAISLMIAYVLNSVFNFKQKISVKKMIKFILAYIPNFVIQNIVVIIFYNMLNLHRLIAYILAAIIGIPITFLIVKLFAFKNNNY